MPTRPYTFDRVVRIVFVVAGAVAAYYFIGSIKGALLPFFVAWLLAYMVHPLVDFFEKRCRLRNRVLSMVVAFLAILVVVMVGVLSLIGPISEQIDQLTVALDVAERTNSTPMLPPLLQSYIDTNLDWSKIASFVTFSDVKEALQSIVPQMWQFLTGTFDVVVGVLTSFIALIYMIFILLDYEKISKGWINLVPPAYRPVVAMVARDVVAGMNSYFRGQALVAFLMGVLFSIGFTVIQLPMAIPLGMFIGLLNMVPYLQILGILPMALMCFLKSVNTGDPFLTIFLLGLAVIGVAQVLQDTVLVPRIMGKVTGLNPAIILLSLSVWGALLGVLGMIIALPMTTILLSYYNNFILRGTIDAEQEDNETNKPIKENE